MALLERPAFETRRAEPLLELERLDGVLAVRAELNKLAELLCIGWPAKRRRPCDARNARAVDTARATPRPEPGLP